VERAAGPRRGGGGRWRGPERAASGGREGEERAAGRRGRSAREAARAAWAARGNGRKREHVKK
jgi:hypothetical protein